MTLTPSELLFVDRQLRGLTQHQAARLWKTTFWTYRSWEANPNLVPRELRDALAYREKEVDKPLLFVLLRRRESMTQAELGEKLGVSRQWVNLMERDLESYDLLEQYWEQ